MKASEKILPGMTTEEYHEDDVHDYIDKSMATQEKKHVSNYQQ